MRKFIITTDNMSDLPEPFINENNIGQMSLSYILDGETYNKDNSLSESEFYDRMRKGSMPITSQINPEAARIELEKYLKEGYDIIHVAFSSALSGSCNSVNIAAKELAEEYPEAKIVVIDSLLASLGQGLLVCKLVEMKKEKKSFEELVKWATDNREHICSYFTVDDLFHLFRGGRVSKATAIIGSIINIKPVLHIDKEGKLISIGKARGRKKSLLTLIDKMDEKMGRYKEDNKTIFISHGDCLQDAQFVQQTIKERYAIESFIVSYVGPVIGAHSGPGTLALFFMGEER
jgi:EDD domain protein, DegV family